MRMASSGRSGARGVEQFPKFAVNARDVRDHFHQADDGQAVRIHHGPDTRLLHARSGAAEELQVRAAAAERVHQSPPHRGHRRLRRRRLETFGATRI